MEVLFSPVDNVVFIQLGARAFTLRGEEDIGKITKLKLFLKCLMTYYMSADARMFAEL